MLNGVEIELETTISPAIEMHFGEGFKWTLKNCLSKTALPMLKTW
jgi:hypothetical protein